MLQVNIPWPTVALLPVADVTNVIHSLQFLVGQPTCALIRSLVLVTATTLLAVLLFLGVLLVVGNPIFTRKPRQLHPLFFFVPLPDCITKEHIPELLVELLVI